MLSTHYSVIHVRTCKCMYMYMCVYVLYSCMQVYKAPLGMLQCIMYACLQFCCRELFDTICVHSNEAYSTVMCTNTWRECHSSGCLCMVVAVDVLPCEAAELQRGLSVLPTVCATHTHTHTHTHTTASHHSSL